MLKYLLIALVVGLALAPLTHFLPSKRQRQVARMREFAAVQGLFVEFRDLPGFDDRRESRPEQVIYYGRRLAPSRGKRRQSRAWLAAEEGWRGVNHREPAPDCFTGLPPQIMAASVDESSCGVYWLEADEDTGVEAIVDVLQTWSEALNAPV